MLGQVPQSLQRDTFALLVQLDSVGLNCTFTQVSLLAELLSSCMSIGSLQNLAAAPLLKDSVCGPHTASLSWFSTCSTSPKSIKSFLVRAVHSLPAPLTVLGDRVSLWNSPSWCCSYGLATHCVCSLSLPVFVCPPSLSQLWLVVCLCGSRALLLEERGQLSCIFCLFSPLLQAFGTEHFPLNL